MGSSGVVQRTTNKQAKFDWIEIVKTGATYNLKPQEVFELELWKYNAYVTARQDSQKEEAVNAILTGYYTAYYMSGGSKAKSPKELIDKLYNEKQSLSDGFADIERIKRMEKNQQ